MPVSPVGNGTRFLLGTTILFKRGCNLREDDDVNPQVTQEGPNVQDWWKRKGWESRSRTGLLRDRWWDPSRPRPVW